MKIAIYLSAIPNKSKNEFKRTLLENFAHGAKAAGDDVYIVDDVHTVIDSDIAVLQGWVGMKQAPHLEQRQRVISHQRQSGSHTLIIDSNLFGFLEPGDFNRYLRYSLDGIFPTTGYYFDQDIDPGRWDEIKQSYGFQERPWRPDGLHVTLCLQRDGGWSMDGVSVIDWLETTIPLVRAYTQRPILIRPHPSSTKVVPEIQRRWPRLEISQNSDLRHDLNRSWCTVAYNSSPGVASILWGVPTFVTDPDPGRSQTFGYAATDLSLIGNPPLPDREKFYHRLAQCHFATEQLCNGQAWSFMRDRIR